MIITQLLATVCVTAMAMAAAYLLAQDATWQDVMPYIGLIFFAAWGLTMLGIWRTYDRENAVSHFLFRAVCALHGFGVAAALGTAAATGRAVFLLAAVPSGLVLLALALKARPGMLAQWGGRQPAVDWHAYYMQHKGDIDAMMQAFRRVLVEKHGMREDYVATLDMRNAIAPDVPVAAAWHFDGHTPEEMAGKLIDTYYFSRDANNPVIFAKHMDTGEDLPPDYDYDHWAHRNFGRTAGQKFATAAMLLVLGGCLYGLFFATFLPAAQWHYLALGISVALSAALCARLFAQLAQGRLRTQPGKRKLKKWDLVWLAPFAVFFCWLSIGTGIGLPATQVFGAPHEAVYEYRKNSSKPCLSIQAEVFSLSRFCLARDAYNRLSPKGAATFKGKKSWFGESLEYMQAD